MDVIPFPIENMDWWPYHSNREKLLFTIFVTNSPDESVVRDYYQTYLRGNILNGSTVSGDAG